MVKLSVRNIVKNSYLTTWYKGWHFFRLSWLWAGLLITLGGLILLVGKAAQIGFGLGANASPIAILIFFTIVNVLLWLALASIATGWHRIVQNINPPQKPYYLAADAQVWRYLGSMYLFGVVGVFTLYPVLYVFGLVVNIPSSSTFAAPIEKIVLGAFGFLWLWSGFSLLLPAVAVGHNRLSFIQILQLGKGNRLKLVIIQFMPLIIGLAIILALNFLERYFAADSVVAFLIFLLLILVVLVSWLVYLSTLSLSYQALSKQHFADSVL